MSEANVPIRERSPEERREYYRNKKSEQRAREKQEREQQAETLDPWTKRFIEWFNNVSLEDRRAWLRVHPGYLKIEFERMKKYVKDAFVREGYTEDEPNDNVLRTELAEHYGFTEAELAGLLDGSFKPAQHPALIGWPPPRKVAPLPIPALPAPPVTSAAAAVHAETKEVQTELALTPMERRMREMPIPPGMPESWWRK